tara:strand:+ start:107 stop:586 length:480 start_codon:yes stop_codon:yes gene_type:complete
MDWMPDKLITLLNAIGLPVLTYAIVLMYRTLVKRSSFLQSSIKDMKEVYDSVIKTAKHRSSELEASIDNQSKFNELYLKMVTDSSEHVEKIKEWKKSEIVILEDRMNSISKDLEKANDLIIQLKQENDSLNIKISAFKIKLDSINQSVGPGESMARGFK